MKNYFPVFLDLEGKNVLLVGGGAVAEQKLERLLNMGARIRIVAEQASETLLRRAREKNVKYESRAFRDSDLGGQDLVFCATDNPKLHERVSRLCAKSHIWVNAADQPDKCSFIMPAVFRRGGIAAAISTGGLSPAVAQYLRRRLEKLLGPEVERLLEILGGARKELLKLRLSERRKVLKGVMTESTLERLKGGQEKNIKRELDGLLKGKKLGKV